MNAIVFIIPLASFTMISVMALTTLWKTRKRRSISDWMIAVAFCSFVVYLWYRTVVQGFTNDSVESYSEGRIVISIVLGIICGFAVDLPRSNRMESKSARIFHSLIMGNAAMQIYLNFWGQFTFLLLMLPLLVLIVINVIDSRRG